ncbi:hypothetical protein WN73_12185 [Bradyrhizobium sp. CCBAU 45394]|uniref:tyrosine-type recombinase/integrase n=1 Tax=Bradyrhizobium sp. CCBAU 45394 TaxID=1325087 RepID=UPI002304CC4B|nr:site-specific integrase [Bradyrhizobium sp. CCBAU 45394]MDA9391407.1 hypothetical protein [Bradyrhizobium sp. CCBAU 45394]
MTKALTAASVARFRGIEGRCREIPDGGCRGLYLLVFSSGRKSWALRYRRPGSGRPAKLTLGSVYDAADGSEIDIKPTIGGHLSLRSAHRLVAELKHEISLGRDPGASHIAAKREIVTSDKFGGAAVDIIEQYAKRKTRRWLDTARLLGLRPKVDEEQLETIPKGLAERWRDKPITQINSDDIYAVIEETREKGIPGLERRKKGASESRSRSVYAALSTMFGWFTDRRRLKLNPCTGVPRPETPKKRKRVLTNAEIAMFWAACEEVSEPFTQLFRLLLLTGCRLKEVSGMRRSELSDDGQTWIIGGERTKNHETHIVALAPLARDILASVRSGFANNNLIFTTTGSTPVSGFSKAKKALDAAMLAIAQRQAIAAGHDPSEVKILPWRLHDLRRTLVTGMNDLKIMPHVVEAAVNHISGYKAGVAGNYNYAQYIDEKRAAWERWAAHIARLVEDRPANNVEPLGLEKQS